MSQFYKLQVVAIQKETADAVVVSFDVPTDLVDLFEYQPGQYLTLKFNMNGEEVRRSYSLCSTPSVEEPLRIGVKRVKNGLVSNYINDTLKVGDTIEVMPPDGRFFANVKKKQYKTYYLFAAGSGITPILSILKSVLYVEERSYIHMIYGNSHQDSIMFKAELDQLQKQYPDRFLLVHSLSKAKSSWFSSKTDFEYRKGRVDKDAVKWMIDTYPPYAQNVEYYICGPGKMIENTEKALQNLDVPKDRIFKESFGGGDEKVITDGVENAQLSARLNGKNISTSIKKGTTVLRALIDAGEDPPYSCESGVCSTCICQVTKGEVEMKKNFALEDKEVAKGYVLSCQSVPLTEEVEVVFE